MPTTVNVSPLKINYLTESQYQTALNNGEINSNELYFTPSVDYLPLTGGTMSGVISLASTGLSTYDEAGYSTDQYGNFVHKRTNESDYWNLKNNAGSGTFGIKYESGEVNLGTWKASPVEIPYGGTGATDAATARTNLGITPANIGAAAASHTHDYLPLTGGTMTGMITFNSSTASTGSFKIFAAKSSDDTSIRAEIWSEANHALSFVEKLKGASVAEVYLLPAPTSGNDARYNILTDKSGIELPRGGVIIANNGSYFRVDRSDYSDDSTPSSNQYLTFAAARSTTDGYDRTYVRYFGGTDGKQGMQLETRRTISSTNYYNTLTMTIGTDGTKYVSVSDPAAWRTALGLGSMATQASSSYLPLSGGTVTGNVTTKISSWDNTTAPSSTKSFDNRLFNDNNNYSIMFERIHQDTANTVGVEYGVRRQISSSTIYWNSLRLNVSSTGVKSVSLDQSSWLTALGLSGLGAVTQAVQSTNIAVAQSTYTKLTQITLAAGTYILLASVVYATNAAGNRWMAIHTTSASSGRINTWAEWRGAPAEGGGTVANCQTIVTPTANTTYYLNVYHTASATSLNVNGGLIAVRIK